MTMAVTIRYFSIVRNRNKICTWLNQFRIDATEFPSSESGVHRMKPVALKVLATTFVMSLTLTAWSQPPEGGPPRIGRGGPQGKGPMGKGPQGKGQQGGRGRFQLGTVIPPQMVEELGLSAAQSKEITSIEKEVKAKLEKILTKDQLETLNRPPMGGPGGPGGGFGQRGRGGPGGPPDGPDGEDAPPKKKGQAKKKGPPRDDDN
jgi:hypothetical protein